MKRFSFVILALIVVLLAGCAHNLKLSEEAKLKQELRKWESFSGSGIVEISVFGFSMRKPFAIAKSLDEMRMDVVEGGLLGATGSPIISMYLGEYFSLKSPLVPLLEAVNLGDNLPLGALSFFSSADNVVSRYGEEIIANKAIIRDSLQINFSSDYKIESIVDKPSSFRIDNTYTRKGDIDEISFSSPKGISAKFIFDGVDYERPQITVLPKNENRNLNIMDILNQGGTMELLKAFLGD